MSPKVGSGAGSRPSALRLNGCEAAVPQPTHSGLRSCERTLLACHRRALALPARWNGVRPIGYHTHGVGTGARRATLLGMRIDVIDDSTRAAVLRLTRAERECLKRCLSHQTAKQMALELGVSPHAVEKRLKMARAKLGLSSSLEAAKLVEATERSGHLVPYSPDLPSGRERIEQEGSAAVPPSETAWITRHRTYVVSGAMLMSVLAAVVLIMAM